MPNPRQDLQVLIHTSAAKTTLVANISREFEALTFSTALHGGFKELRCMAPMDLGSAYLALNRETAPGWHFYHVSVLQDNRIVWEGRLIDPFIYERGLSFGAVGYYSSLRDQFYDAADAGNTDWTTGGPHTVDDIIKEMLTNECPDISSDQSHIDAPTRDLTGIDLTDRDYVQTIIIDKLAPFADSGSVPWYFAIWDDQVPYFSQRDVSSIDWLVWTSALGQGWHVGQRTLEYRSRVLPVKDGVEGTSATDSDAETNWPIREAKVTVQKGAPTAAENDLRDTFLGEVKRPRQIREFPIKGRILSTTAAHHLGPATGAGTEKGKWWVRAGHVMRIEDLIPSSAATPSLDDLRTFFIMETRYDAVHDLLYVTPDRPRASLSTLLARRIQLQPDR